MRLDRDQQDGLSRATVRVLKCRQDCEKGVGFSFFSYLFQDRDRREEDYAESLREYEDCGFAQEVDSLYSAHMI